MTAKLFYKQIKRLLWVIPVFTLTLCLTIFVNAPAKANILSCHALLQESNSEQTRSYSEIKELKFMAFNVENLFVSTGKTEWTSIGVQKSIIKKPPQPKPEHDIEKVRAIIKEELPDVLIITEVESQTALEYLAKNSLQGLYKSFLIEGNDGRGIDIGFLVKSDLPFLVEHQTHRDIKWFDPVDKQTVKLFSRDVPALLLRKSANENPFLIILGNHAKSKRDRPGDPESFLWRKAQYEGIAKIVQNYAVQYAKVPIILGGDFNTEVNTAAEIQPLLSLLKSGFNLTDNSTPLSERITHTYHPRDGPVQQHQMDDIKVSPELADKIIEARIYRYKNADGTIMPFARTFAERNRQPSDHLPVKIRISTSGLWSPIEK